MASSNMILMPACSAAFLIDRLFCERQVLSSPSWEYPRTIGLVSGLPRRPVPQLQTMNAQSRKRRPRINRFIQAPPRTLLQIDATLNAKSPDFCAVKKQSISGNY